MSDNNQFLKSIRESAGMRLAVLFGCFFVFLILTSIISLAINQLPFGSERDHTLWTAVFQNILAFCLPAFILAKYSSNRPIQWLKLNKRLRIRPLIGVLIVYLISMPAMEWIIDWNQNIHFPEALSGIEKLFRSWEENGEEVTKMMLDINGFIPMIIGFLIIGVLTGFSEELFFRGGLQGIFTRTPMGIPVAVWLAAFIFSAMHFQFFGFLPRLLMGAFFGYVLVWTQDVKVSAFAHMLNNGSVVLASYFLNVDDITTSTFTTDAIGFQYLPFVSLIATALFLIFCRGFFFKQNKTQVITWQKSQLPPVSEN